MKKNTLLLIFLFAGHLAGKAQNLDFSAKAATSAASVQPFLYSVNTLSPGSPQWNFNYSGSYGERTSGAYGYDGIDQQLAIKGYLGNRFTLYANAGVGLARSGSMNSTQQVEVIRDFIGGRKPVGPRLGLGFGLSRDWDNVKSVFSRVTAFFDNQNWRFGSNLRFEKAFSQSRDNIDLITSVGVHHKVKGSLYVGAEAVGQDLEGFWEKNEAEGGAKLLIGPSLNMAPVNSKFAFSLCGGPVFYATSSNVMPSIALRDLTTQNGYTVKAMVTFNFHN